MTRIDDKLFELKANKQKALVAFVTAGDPSLKETEKLILTMEKAGVDIIELGIPFSDPMADGPVIQESSERALKQGVTLGKVLELVESVRAKTEIPILLMGYVNPLFAMGFSKFADRAHKAGVDGVLIVDMPPEESDECRRIFEAKEINQIFLLAPTSDEERIRKATKVASGFIYYVSITGVTGAQLNVTEEVKEQVFKIRHWTDTPVIVGFGISKPEQVKALSQKADGVVVGSALVKLIHDHAKSDSLHEKVHKYLQSLKNALS